MILLPKILEVHTDTIQYFEHPNDMIFPKAHVLNARISIEKINPEVNFGIYLWR